MTKCPICGSEYDDTVSFCTECGVKLHHDQPTYTAAGEYTHTPEDNEKPLSMGSYMLMELLARIPVVNLIVLLIWSFSSDTNTNRKNWSRARLIWVAIGLVAAALGIAALIFFGSILTTSVNNIAFSYWN